MSISAMQQALEALEWNYGTDLENIENCTAWLDKLNATIPALRQAIAEAEKQEPAFYVIPATDRFGEGYEQTFWEDPAGFPVYTRPVVHEVRCTYPQCQATNGCVGSCSKGQAEKQEPVAWVDVKDSYEGPYEFHGIERMGVGKHLLYTAPVHASDISQKPVDETAKDRHELAGTIPISNGGIATRTPSSFISPPKREWVGLSDKEVKKIVDKNTSDIWCNGKGVARDVEAKLKEKNT